MQKHTPARPWCSAPAQLLASVRGVFTDIDDTLTRDGTIEPAALAALHDLHAAGVVVVAITGRPWGWSEPFAKAWPVAAIVAENGAVGLFKQAQGVSTRFVQDDATRSRNAQRLAQVLQDIESQLPGARRARDSAGRLTDIAIDHSEFTQLPAATIAKVQAHMQAAGLVASVSSIHINGWLGTHNKWTGAGWAVQTLWGRRLEAEMEHWLFVGDSTNDQPLFERFAERSVGVANLLRFEAELLHWPRYITQAERGQGFAEVAQALLAARRPPAPG